MESIRLIESVEDNFHFGRAYVIEESGGLSARAIVGDKICDITSKPTLLENGIAFCSPIDSTSEHHWPINVRIEKTTQDNVRYEETLWNCTGNARIVQAARKFNELTAQGRARAGMEL